MPRISATAVMAAVRSWARKSILDVAVEDSAVNGKCNSPSQEADRMSV